MRAALQGFGPYRLLSIVGEGEVCSVYRAVRDADGPTAFPIALAIVHPVGAADADAAAAFSLRSEAAQGFFHRSIAATIDSGVLEGRAYAIRELADGASMDLVVPKRGKGLKPAVAKHILVTVLQALAAAREHRGGLAHGRLDLGDLVADSDGVVRITGFGQPDASPAADLLSVARLAQSMCRAWPAQGDAWIDRVQDGASGFTDPAEALVGLQNITLENEEKAVAGLARRVKRHLKAAAVEVPERDAGADLPSPTAGLDGAEATSSKSSRTSGDHSGKAKEGREGADRARGARSAAASGDDEGASPRRASDRRTASDRRLSERRAAPRHPELEAGIRQARWVAALCGVAVLAALVIEITRHIG